MPLGNMKEMYRKSPSLMELVVSKDNLLAAAKAVRRNKGAAGVDGMTVWEVEEHIEEFYLPLRQKLLDGTYKPKPVKRVEIPKPDGTKRKLGIPCARDRVVQQAIRQVIEPIIDPQFLPQSHGFRPGKGTHTALKQCVAYYEEGYKVVVDCDLKQCFDTLNHDKLMYHLEQFIQDKAILKVIRKFLMSGVIDLSGEFVESKTGAPQGGVLSPLLSNVYLHELDKELEKRGHHFVRYADDFVIYVRTKRAGERVLESVSRFIERDLKLIVNTDKSKVGSPTRLKFLSCLMKQVNGTCRFIPTKEAKKKFRAELKRRTSRKRPGDFKTILNEINQVTRGWIGYFGLGFIKSFIQKEIEPWIHHRIRQLILKRWKLPKTKITKLLKYGLNLDSAKRIGYSRKKYWRLSKSPEVHWALTNERLHHWGLVSLSEMVESAYARY
ncbi:group II intron reverse transcriptase/maturase [Desemzia sp. C1]|uniref:group II intron reverse transcriptase/maturase n=1 Tax=Desemzia sp. C1 TaxID=2892016 RepID=UPI001E31052C|nr:group II intron reverse transcriptase/maturase [Desemzia sp. C1]MCI3027930.1 group II intron reverse transcriptase/maturase [Desemzia sp. C1]